MDTSNIKFWFENSFQQGRLVQVREQSEEKDVDGRAIWGGIESQVKHVMISEEICYKDILKPIYKDMEKLISKYDMESSEFEPKSNHFFMQLKNLVDKKSDFKVQLNRLFQISFNAGQLSMLLDKIPSDVKEFIITNKLLEIDTYLSLENQELINKKYLDDTELDKIRENVHNLGGGAYSYQHKYYKYKAKYLQLKKLIK